MSVRTIKVSNVSVGAFEQELREFFSFSGDIEYVEMKSEDERSQTAYVTFKDVQGAETAVLLTGATIVDKIVSVKFGSRLSVASCCFCSTCCKNHCLNFSSHPPTPTPPPEKGIPIIIFCGFTKSCQSAQGAGSAFRKAEDVVSSMLAKGCILGKDAVNKAKTFAEKHHLTSTASAKVASLDQKIGFTEKISMGAAVVNDKVREVDHKYQVSEKTKSALAAAEQKVTSAGSAIMKNRYVFTGASWVTGAFNKVTKAAGEVGEKTKEKVGMAEDERRQKVVDDFAKFQLSESDSPRSFVPSENETQLPMSESPKTPKSESPKASAPPPSESPNASARPESESPNTSAPPKSESPKASAPSEKQEPSKPDTMQGSVL